MTSSSAAAPDDPSDLAALARHAEALTDAILSAVPGWVQHTVAARCRVDGQEPSDEVRTAASAAGAEAVAQLAPELRALLAADVDAQRRGPLELVRAVAPHATAVLRAAQVAPPRRDDVAVRLHPDDVYDIGPAAFADLGPAVHEAGITWGAAKAHVVLARRRREGLR